MLDYKNSILHIENLAINEIAKKVGTPFYCYSKKQFENNYKEFKQNFSDYPTTICFAVKSCPNIHILKLLASLGSGADTVSQGEIIRALKAGIKPEKIVFSGVGKTKEEIKFALQKNIGQLNAESLEELEIIDKIAGLLKKKAKVSLRVNPDVDGKTHEKITTGRKHDKFGIPLEDAKKYYDSAAKLDNIKIEGIACHIGSQITDIEPFKQAFQKVAEFANTLKKRGFELKRLDLGGGVGIKYKNEETISIKDYAKAIISAVKSTGLKLFLEPGRRISGDAGILVTEVQFIKNTGERQFAILDAGMNDLARPAIYGAYHEIIQVRDKDGEKKNYDIVGPVCESSDIFGRDRKLFDLKAGELLVILNAGAYGASMASNYNTRPLIPEILVDDKKFKIIRRRQKISEIFEYE
ncbi:MAG: diaminopimelate decarboxylase [Rickettsiales bacterium]|nr:diaminopimelate decarboxylase [Rickettsiales bacterium]